MQTILWLRFLRISWQRGRMTEEDAARDSRRHSLRSAVMGDDIHLIDVSSQPVMVEEGDRLLLASDGLMTLSEQEIAEILKKTQDAPLEDSAAGPYPSGGSCRTAPPRQYDCLIVRAG